MKIIYDENKIQEIKQSADEQNEKLFTTYKSNYKKIIRLTAIASIISFFIGVICFFAVIYINHKQPFSLFEIIIMGIITTIPLGISIFSLESHMQEREFRRRDFDSYEKKTGEFSYPASVKYNLFIEDKNPHSFTIIGNSNNKTVNVEVLAKNSDEEVETILLYDFEVSRSIDDEDIIIDLMDKRVIYPLEDKTQEFEFYPVFDGDILKKI